MAKAKSGKKAAPKNIKVSAKTAGNVKGGHKLLYSK